jgi:hypothetical protein
MGQFFFDKYLWLRNSRKNYVYFINGRVLNREQTLINRTIQREQL